MTKLNDQTPLPLELGMMQLPVFSPQWIYKEASKGIEDPLRFRAELKRMAINLAIREIFVDPWHTIKANKISYIDPDETGVATVNNSGGESATPGNEPVEGSPI